MSSRVGNEKEKADNYTHAALVGAGINSQYLLKIDPSGYAETDILKATKSMFRKESWQETFSNFIYTVDPTITLVAKPGDCPVAIVFAEASNGKQMLGLLHAGRTQLDKQLPKQVIAHLVTHGFATQYISVGIAPSIAFSNYFIQEKDLHMLPGYANWQDHGRAKKRDKKIYLDLLGFFSDQLQEAGIAPNHIQAYVMDTYESSKNHECFSHRYAVYTDQEELNGRFLVAAQLVTPPVG